MPRNSHISEDPSAFENLLLELSTQFINLPTEQIDSLIEDTQKRVCDFFGYDLSALWQWTTEGPHFMKCTHLYSPPGGPKRPAHINAELAFPWSFKRVMAGQVVLVQTEKMPEEAALERETRRHYGVKSTAQFPLIASGGLPIGGVSFANLHQEHITEPDTVKRLKLVAQIFSNALIRKYDYEGLCRSEERLKLATTAAGAGVWEYDCVTQIFWVSEQIRSLFSYDALEQISLERFSNSIYPADLQRVLQPLTAAIENGVPVDIDYRIRIGTDQLKWIRSKGQLYADANGEPVRILGVSIDISDHKHLENELNEQLKTIQSLKKKLEGENLYLREALEKEQGFEQVVGNSKPLKKVLTAARQVAATDATVLLFGETGTGKGVLANAIFKMSSRRDKPFVIVNCAALPANLIESELFGREKGAFTGAHARQLGRFEIADRGTIFLDEIGELPLALQAKLLRVLQDGEFERLGSARTVKVDVRVIAATARDLYQEVQTNKFRQDLFYRLNVFPITIPPLRQRSQDIALLVQYFIDKYSRKMGKDIQSIPQKCMEKLMQYSWPGNVRELEHLIERSVIISPENSFVLADGFDTISATILTKQSNEDMASVERSHIKEVLRKTEWKIDGPGGAASILGIHPSTLRFRMKKLGIHRPI
jgi:transcriptional regulator with GAF, ATPase, and Fis domain